MIRYSLLGFAFYIVFLLVTLPANVVYGYWKEYLGADTDVSLTGLEGSIWSGHVSQAVIGSQKLQPMSWSFKPLSLFLGNVEVQWEFTVPDGFGKGISGYSLVNGYYAQNVEAWLPLSMIVSFTKLSALNPGGEISINLDELYSDGETITRVTGKLAWQNASISIFKPVELGSYALDLTQVGDDINGVITDQGGPIEAQGEFTLLPDGEYKFEGQLSVRDKKRKDLTQTLATLGRPDRQGKVKLSQKGNIKKLAF